MNYYIGMINDRDHVIKIQYKKVESSRDGMFRILKYITSKSSGSLEARGGKYYTEFQSCRLECSWEKDQGMFIRYLDLPEYKGRWTQGLEQVLDELNRQDVQAALDQANRYIVDMAWFDFAVNAYNGQDLSIIGSIDLSYYYQMEVVFEGASYFNISSSWNTSPSEELVFTLGNSEDYKEVNQYAIDGGYSVIVKIKSEDSEKHFLVACYGVTVKNGLVKYDRSDTGELEDKEKIILKYGLVKEGDGWYQKAENSHKALIFKDHFLKQNDILGMIFRIHKLCFAKVKYFRQNIDKFQPCKHHFQDGFIETDLWDSEFLRHKASGFMVDYRYLQSIHHYQDFLKFCKLLEEFEF